VDQLPGSGQPRISRARIEWLRRDYGRVEEHTLELTTTKTDVDTSIADIKFLYIEPLTDDVTVELYKNLSPESWTVGDFVLIAGVDECTKIAMKASAAATAKVLIAGN
jgi:hypothetical protein